MDQDQNSLDIEAMKPFTSAEPLVTMGPVTFKPDRKHQFFHFLKNMITAPFHALVKGVESLADFPDAVWDAGKAFWRRDKGQIAHGMHNIVNDVTSVGIATVIFSPTGVALSMAKEAVKDMHRTYGPIVEEKANDFIDSTGIDRDRHMRARLKPVGAAIGEGVKAVKNPLRYGAEKLDSLANPEPKPGDTLPSPQTPTVKNNLNLDPNVPPF